MTQALLRVVYVGREKGGKPFQARENKEREAGSHYGSGSKEMVSMVGKIYKGQ